MNSDPRTGESRTWQPETGRGAEDFFPSRIRSCEVAIPNLILSASFAAVVTLVLLASLLVGVSRADDVDLLIDKALDLSGLTAQLEALPGAILNSVPDEAFPAGTKKNQPKGRNRKLIDDSAVQAAVHKAVRTRCEPLVIEQVVGFYGSSLGRKVGRLQRSALSDSTLQGIREGWKIVASLDPDRLVLIERLVRANNVGERNSRLLHAAVRGLAEGVSPSDAPDVTSKKVAEVGKAIRSLEATTHNTAIVAYAYTFRTLKDGELEQLISFQESEAAMRFSQAVQAGIEEAVKQVAKELGKSRRRSDVDSAER